MRSTDLIQHSCFTEEKTDHPKRFCFTTSLVLKPKIKSRAACSPPSQHCSDWECQIVKQPLFKKYVIFSLLPNQPSILSSSSMSLVTPCSQTAMCPTLLSIYWGLCFSPKSSSDATFLTLLAEPQVSVWVLSVPTASVTSTAFSS